MQDKFTDFCNDDAVQEALCDIVAKQIEDWFDATRRVTLGLDNSWVARKNTLVDAARVLGMIDLVCSITDLAPEDIVQLDPEKCHTLIFYIADMLKVR